MPVYAIYTNKRAFYRDHEEDMGNTYHYKFPTPATDEELTEVLDRIITLEQSITPNEINFIGGTAWGPTDGPEVDSVMRIDVERDLTGDLLEQFASYATASLNIRWPLPRSPLLNRKRWLRKYMRQCGVPSVTSREAQGRDPISAAAKGDISSRYVNSIHPLGFTSLPDLSLCTADGVEALGPGVVRNFYTTRQMIG